MNGLQLTANGLALLVLRVAIGMYFVVAGVNKITFVPPPAADATAASQPTTQPTTAEDEAVKTGVGAWAEGAQATWPVFMPDSLDSLKMPFLYVLPFAEVLFGATVVLGLFTRLSGFILTLMMVSFIIAVTGSIDGLGDPEAGFALYQMGEDGPGVFHPNVAFLTIALTITLLGGGLFSVDHALRKRSERKRAAAEADARDPKNLDGSSSFRDKA